MPISAESAVEWERAPTAMASPRASYNNFIFHNVFNIHKQSRNDLSFSGKWNVRKKTSHYILFGKSASLHHLSFSACNL
jgi:hypothetical protein